MVEEIPAVYYIQLPQYEFIATEVFNIYWVLGSIAMGFAVGLAFYYSLELNKYILKQFPYDYFDRVLN